MRYARILTNDLLNLDLRKGMGLQDLSLYCSSFLRGLLHAVGSREVALLEPLQGRLRD